MEGECSKIIEDESGKHKNITRQVKKVQQLLSSYRYSLSR